MSTAPRNPVPTKKHLARQQKERKYTLYIIIASIAVGVAVVGLLLYGLLQSSVFQPRQTVADVNGENISTGDWQAQTRFARANIISNATYTLNMATQFNDTSYLSYFAQQLNQYKTQLDPQTISKQVLDQMVDNIIIEKEAEKLGVSVSDAEVDEAIQSAFGFYPNGTPTPQPTLVINPTSTLNPLQLTLTAPTATPVITATATSVPTSAATATAVPSLEATPVVTSTGVVSPTATAGPTLVPTVVPTATPYTEEGFKQLYRERLDEFKTNYNVSESTIRSMFFYDLLRTKVQDAVLADLEPTRPEVWARHILVADELVANDLYDRIQAGEDFCALAADNSTDESNKFNCGDLGWFPKGQMVAAFEDAAFAMKPGDLSEPVQTEFGWHIIQVIGSEVRSISETDFSSLKQTKFTEWLDAKRSEYEINIRDFWADRAPTEPSLPVEVDQFLAYVEQAQQQTPVATEQVIP